MPKHGITALVDFVEPYEAKKAFMKLAYSQFKNAPLYLEWAPENIFTRAAEKTDANTNETVINEESEKKGDEKVAHNAKTQDNLEEADDGQDDTETMEPENDTTLFVKNVNFKTTDGALKKV